MSEFQNDQGEAMVNAIRSIAHGGTSGPTGLEALAMALAGDGLSNDLAGAIDNLATAIRDGLSEVAEALAGRQE